MNQKSWTLSKLSVLLLVLSCWLTSSYAREQQVIKHTPKKESKFQPRYNAMRINGDYRKINSNGMPNHPIGDFPRAGSLYPIEPQYHYYKITAYPQKVTGLHGLHGRVFGFALNGVPFAPDLEVWSKGFEQSQWQQEALGQKKRYGLDKNKGHPDVSGAYHYHGIPTAWFKKLNISASKHSPLIGWAADGFPIYYRYAYDNSRKGITRVVALRSSYHLKQGSRPKSKWGPGGKYDGSLVADYQYIKDSGELDQCNGTFVKTPEFPQGTYAYFLTDQWPEIPRCHVGEPSEDLDLKMIH